MMEIEERLPFMAFLEGGLGETILWPAKNGFPQKNSVTLPPPCAY